MTAALSIAALALQALASPAGWDHFPVFVWTNGGEQLDVVEQFGGACVQRLEDASRLDAKHLDWFVFNAPGRNDLHLDRDDAEYQRRWKEWCDRRDDALLVRKPCLSEPATRERMSAMLSECLKARGGRTGLGVSLGDEVSVTPNGVPEDVCLSPACRAAWREWLAKQPGVDAARREELADPARFSTDATLSALSSGDTSAIGPWLMRRRFEQDVLLARLGELAAQTRRESPGTPVGLLGLIGQTAFGGVAIERVLPMLDFIECYRVGDARELAFTLRRPEQRVILTVFDDPRGPDFSAWQCWEHWMRGGDGLVIWSENELRKSAAFRERVARAVRDIRDVQAKVGRFRPQAQGVALVHSTDSLAVSWLRDAQSDGKTWPKRFPSYQEEHGELEVPRRRWLDFLEDAGLMPGVIPIESVGAGTVRRFPVLVFDHGLFADGDSLARLNAFARAGGRLYLSGPFAWTDATGRVPTGDDLDSISSSAAVHTPAYVEAESVSAAPDRDELDGWRRKLATTLAPFQVSAGASRWECIAAWQPDGLGFTCAALPKPRRETPQARDEILPDAITIDAGKSWRVEWIHPTPDESGVVKLPRGDAAVFRLAPKKD